MDSSLDFASREILLALDLVAGWQLEKIKGSELWDDWEDDFRFCNMDWNAKSSSSEESSTGPAVGTSWRGLIRRVVHHINGQKLTAECSTEIDISTVELEVQKDKCYMAAWGNFHNDWGNPIVCHVVDGYMQTDCPDNCVCPPLPCSVQNG